MLSNAIERSVIAEKTRVGGVVGGGCYQVF